MVAYSYKKRFAGPMRAGIKNQTMRNDRKRHARPGEEVQNYTGMRTAHCQLIGRGTCVAITPVRIDFKLVNIRVEGRGLISGAAALDLFAVMDGFGDWTDMRAFWMEEHGKVRPEDGSRAGPLLAWSGWLIEWNDFRVAETKKAPELPGA